MSWAYVLEVNLKEWAPGRISSTYLEGCSPAHPVLHDIYFSCHLGDIPFVPRTYPEVASGQGGGVLDNVLEYICPGEHVVQIHRAKHKVRPGDGLNLCRVDTFYVYVVKKNQSMSWAHLNLRR